MNTRLLHAYMVAAICVCSLVVSGCASQRRISLDYQPIGQQKAAAPLTVAVMKFADRRADKTVGMISGPSMAKMSLVPSGEKDAGQWIAGAMAAELSQAGLQVTVASPGTVVTIMGNVIDVNVRTNAGIKAVVTTDVIVITGGVAVLARQYTGSFSVAPSAAPTVDDCRGALESALQDAMKKAVPEVLAAIE
jgi:hypothetical protein